MAQVYNRSPAWIEVADLKPKSVVLSGDEVACMSVIAFSGDGSHLAAGTNRGDLLVWHVATGQLVTETKAASDHPITSIDWNPVKSNQVAFIDKNGHWGVVKAQMANSSAR